MKTIVIYSTIQYAMIFIAFRYKRELNSTRWGGIRQGALFGVFTGWLSLITYLVYATGFIFGSLLMSNTDAHSVNISDILVVSNSFGQLRQTLIYDYYLNVDRFYLCSMFGVLQLYWSFLSIIFRSSRCSGIGVSTY